MTLQELHALLETAFRELAATRFALPAGMSSDTAHAVGFALGAIDKAKALVGRDIGDRGNTKP